MNPCGCGGRIYWQVRRKEVLREVGNPEDGETKESSSYYTGSKLEMSLICLVVPPKRRPLLRQA